MLQETSTGKRTRALLPATLASLAVFIGGCADTGTGRWSHMDYQLGYNLPFTERDTLSQPLSESDVVSVTPRILLVQPSL